MDQLDNKSNTKVVQFQQQAGVILFVTLIALVIMTIGALAIVRSFDTSMTMSGNMAFRRDLVNQGELGVNTATNLLSTGSLSTDEAQQQNHYDLNYSAQVLASNNQGIPLALVDNRVFTETLGMSSSNDITDSKSGVTIRYVIDRMCNQTGAFDTAKCSYSTITSEDKGGSDFIQKPSGFNRPTYRISIRVSGARSTQAYIQAIVLK